MKTRIAGISVSPTITCNFLAVSLRGNITNSDFQLIPLATTNSPHVNWLGIIASVGVDSVTGVNPQGQTGVIKGNGVINISNTAKKLQVMVGETEIPAILVFTSLGHLELYTEYNGAGDIELYHDNTEAPRLHIEAGAPTIRLGTDTGLHTTVTSWTGIPLNNTAVSTPPGGPVTLRMVSSNDATVIALTEVIARGQRFAPTDFQTGVDDWIGFIAFHGTESIGIDAARHTDRFTTTHRIEVLKGGRAIHGALVRESATDLALITAETLGSLTLLRSTLGNAASAFGAAQAGAGATRYLDGVDGTSVHRYHWANFPALTAGTNLAITSDDSTVTINLVEALPSDEFVTDADLVAIQKAPARPEDMATPSAVRGFALAKLRDFIVAAIPPSGATLANYATTAAADTAGVGNNTEVLIGANRDKYMKVNGVWRALRTIVPMRRTVLYSPAIKLDFFNTIRTITLSESYTNFDILYIGARQTSSGGFAVSSYLMTAGLIPGDPQILFLRNSSLGATVTAGGWWVRVDTETQLTIRSYESFFRYLARVEGKRFSYGYGT